QRKGAVGGVTVAAERAEPGRRVLRLREFRRVEEGAAAQFAVVVGIAGAGGGERDRHLQFRCVQPRRVERETGGEAGELAGEYLALVLAGEGEGGTRRLRIVGGEGWGRGQREGEGDG